jgi:DMATS type aromatic prenyltransferase
MIDHSLPIPQARAKATYASLGLARLSALWRALARSECPGDVKDLFTAMLAPWGDSRLPAAPAWPSDITDDHTPFEFSVAFSQAKPELRILVEAQGASPTLASTMAAGIELNRALAARGANFERFRAVEDLFLPRDPVGRFALWHAAALVPGEAPSFRVYLNPQVQGVERSYALVEEALVRLGLKDAFPALAAGARRSPPHDELRYFSLDLSADARARVKIYVYHHDATVDDLERAYSVAGNHAPGAVAELCEAIAGTRDRLLTPPGTCFAFVQGDEAPTATLHLPIRFYTENDGEARARIRDYFVRKEIPVEPYDQVLEAAAHRPLEAGSGLQTYASLRLGRAPRVTVYLAPEAFRTAPPRVPERKVTVPRPEAVVERYERESIVHHPFLQRLRREPQNPGVLWLLLVNSREGIVRNFTRRLANVVARVDDVRIRSILAHQLNDELGNGDASRAHALLFDNLVAGLDPLKPAVIPDDVLAPGRELSRRLEDLYVNRDAVEIGRAHV